MPKRLPFLGWLILCHNSMWHHASRLGLMAVTRERLCSLFMHGAKTEESYPIRKISIAMVYYYSSMNTWRRRIHDDVIQRKHFPRYWPFVRGIHRSPVNSPHKGQWRGALMLSLMCVWINGWVNTREAGDLRRNQAHYDVIVMLW